MPITGRITDRMMAAYDKAMGSPEYGDEDYDDEDESPRYRGPEYDDEAGLGEVDDLKEHGDFAQDDVPEGPHTGETDL